MTAPPPDRPLDDPFEHLWKAARELLAAARALIDAADAVVEHQLRAPKPADEPRLRRIDVQ